MKIETIMKRIEGKEKEIQKLQKKMERILKAKATGWEVNPYWYNESDVRRTQRDLDDAIQRLRSLKDDLQKETEKANSRNIKVILDFLEDWKAKVRAYYRRSYAEYVIALKEWYRKDHEYCVWWNYKRDNSPEAKQIIKEHRQESAEFQKQWSFITPYVDCHKEFQTEKFESDLKAEAEKKYDDIIERTNEITGTIKDATGLRIGEKGDLDGFVIGERGTAHVHTIGAGGYNIQCYHFRVLVHEVK